MRRRARRPRRPSRYRGYASFFVFVLIPTLIVALYYSLHAADQYTSELRFSLRGTETSPLSSLGLTALPGTTGQAADAYIVIDYVNSKQIVVDILEDQGIDLRDFYARDAIDALYQVEPDMSLDQFSRYWMWMVDAAFNSTTGITTIIVTAFEPEDAKIIADAVFVASAKLVNDLSGEASRQLISTANTEVGRTEQRLTDVRIRLSSFRNREQLLNPTLMAQSETDLIQSLERELVDLKARRSSIVSTVRANSPAIRMLDSRIQTIENEVQSKRRAIGSGSAGEDAVDGSLSTVLLEYEGLLLEQEFASKAYTSALSSLETSQAEARKQSRYFALIVTPGIQETALRPLRLVNTLIVFFLLLVIWSIGFLLVEAIKDRSA